MRIFDNSALGRHFFQGDYPSSERGSFIVGALLFLFIFLFVAGFAIDISNYYNKQSKLQDIADGAALSAGRSLEQYTDNPDESKSYKAVRQYIKERQGKEKLEVYATNELQNNVKDNVEVRRMETDCSDTNPTSTCYGSSSDTFYLTGMVAYDHFESYFLPDEVFGVNLTGISAQSMAIVEPINDFKTYKTVVDTVPMDCGVIVAGQNGANETVASGQNFAVENNNFCSNINIDIQSNDPSMPGIFHREGQSCSDNLSYCENANKFEDFKEAPTYKYSDPSNYEVNLANYSSLPGGNCDDANSNARLVQTSGGVNAEWDSGSADPEENVVCALPYGGSGNTVDPTSNPVDHWEFSTLKKTGPESDPTYSINKTSDLGRIQLSDNEGVTIYAENDVVFGPGGNKNNNGLRGSIYTTESVLINSNDMIFTTDSSKLYGLAMWAENDITFNTNNNIVRGILGTGDDLDLNNSGGGANHVEGIVTAGDDFNTYNNTDDNIDVTFNDSVFDYSALDIGGWFQNIYSPPKQSRVEGPLFSNVDVRLVKD